VVVWAEAWEQPPTSEALVEAQDWTARRRACALLMGASYRRMLVADKTAPKASRGSGYATSGGRTCTKRWIFYARSLINIPISAW
jgi:hypothetical protein